MALESKTIQVEFNNRTDSIPISPNATRQQIVGKLCKAAGVDPNSKDHVVKLYAADGTLTLVGPQLADMGDGERYRLVVKKAEHASCPAATNGPPDSVLSDVTFLKEQIEKLKTEHRHEHDHPMSPKPPKHTTRSHIRSIENIDITEPLVHNFPPAVTDHLKLPTFDVWQWQDTEMIGLLEHMYQDFGLIDHFKIDRVKLHRFLECARSSYNQNPFHNFRHCFCVTQMMYGLLSVTGLGDKLNAIEKLVLLTSCIGHDLDHPGTNNAYQINANTELAIIYNDQSPLENHHCAVLFAILKHDDTNILENLSEADYKEARKQIIQCILATDMARHGEILAKFKGYVEAGFNYDDPVQRQLLLQIIVKCSDISNEVRPSHVSEPWVDNLLQEFFTQSDREKAEGLPFAPFMDREKVTKAGAQVGFIGFVMIPLFELVAKLLPNMDEHVLQPIKKALAYYKSLHEKQPAA